MNRDILSSSNVMNREVFFVRWERPFLMSRPNFEMPSPPLFFIPQNI